MALPDEVELLCMAVEKMAASEVEKILEEARLRHDRLVRQRMEQIKREQEEQKLYLKRQAFQDARRKVDAAELKARRMVMATREEIFSRILDHGNQRLQDLRKDRKRYVELLQAMVKKASAIILEAGSKAVEIRCASQDAQAAEEAVKNLPEDLRGRVNLSAEPAVIQGGIMAYSLDGKQLVDLSFETVLKRIEPDIRAMAAQRLFKGTGRIQT